MNGFDNPLQRLRKAILPGRQRGQAIYLSLAAIVFLSLMTLAAWNVSQMTHAKSQTMNAADAGAYMLGTTVARDLNFMAYTNRAMVANHAVIGQIVSLTSLSNMIYLAADDISKLQYLSWIPIVGQVLGTIGKVFKQVAKVIDEAVLPGLEILAKAQNQLIVTISNAQTLVHGFAAKDMLDVEKVIQANDPELTWATSDGSGLISDASNVVTFTETFFTKFSERRSDDDAKGRMREVVNLSRDGFTVRREWVPFSLNLGWIRTTTKHLFHGGTELSS
ncbi:MAG: pilus assembly protein TadG-related protein, partial [Azoarcus sp.]|nr:pilus assembly protein TadG-related protein [Azoarcus sp.]